MQDYCFQPTQSRDTAYRFPALRRMVRNWLAKRKLRRLETLDDYLLNDIGLTRDDLHFALRLPRDADPIAEMVRVREQRIGRGAKSK
jgi:uncharacterized protein YjiS (DUF1127 family)